MPKQESESPSAIPGPETKVQNAEFDDVRLLEEEFSAPREVEILEGDGISISPSRHPKPADIDIKSIFGDDADYEFEEWPDEDLLEDGEDPQEFPAALRSRRSADEQGGTLREFGDVQASESGGEPGLGASAGTGESATGSADDRNTADDRKPERKQPKVEASKDRETTGIRYRSIFGNRFLLISSVLAVALALLASQSERLRGIVLKPANSDIRNAGDGEAALIYSGGFQKESEIDSAGIEPAPQNSYDGRLGNRRDSSMQPPRLEKERDSGQTDSAARKNTWLGNVNFRAGGLVQSAPADSLEIAAWESLLATDSRLANRFRGIWGEKSKEEKGDGEGFGLRSRQQNLAGDANLPRNEAFAARTAGESEIEAFANRANEQKFGESGGIGSASGIFGARDSGTFSYESGNGALQGLASGREGAGSRSDARLLEMEARLSLVEKNLELSERGESADAVFGEALRGVASDLEAYRAETDSKMLTLQQTKGIAEDPSHLQHSVERLEKKVDNLSIDLVAIAELAAAGSSAGQNAAAGKIASQPGAASYQSSAGGLVYDHYPVRFLNDSFDSETKQRIPSRLSDAANSTYSISSETREFGIGSELLSPGDRLASFGTILETVRDENGGLLIVASRGAFYVEPK